MMDEVKIEQLFLQLLFTFQTAAWQHLGKIANPLTNKVEQSIPQARFAINMLEMIREKTKGNLTEKEIHLLDKSITELQMNYVTEVNRIEKEGPLDQKKSGSTDAAEPE